MSVTDVVERGREAFAQGRWKDAHAHLLAADRSAGLGAEDLERLAITAYLIGQLSVSIELWGRAHHAFLSRGEVERAVRSAFWLAFELLNSGERARMSGWIARASRLLDAASHDCVERGYLLLPVALQSFSAGDAVSAHARFREAAAVGSRCGDQNLVGLARVGSGRALIRMDKVAEGISELDEAMVAAEAGEVSAIAMGEVYCAVIEGCMETFDLRRAQEWTAAMTGWCEAQPDLVPYAGQCAAQRAEILRLRGQWPEAVQVATQACQHALQAPEGSGSGEAFYQLAELHRLRGEFGNAEATYSEASRRGRPPRPGLAQLRLAQGQADAAAAAIHGALSEATDRHTRCKLLPAYVEIMLAAGDLGAATAGSQELQGLACATGAPLLRAVSSSAEGATLLAAHDASAAVAVLRRAWTTWRDIGAPCEAARVGVLLAQAYRELGDDEGAEMELAAAKAVFQKLGARPELERINALRRSGAASAPGGLTPREVQVLKLVAAGKTNRAIAGELRISEKTVARHISNVYTKLDLSTRAAATAYAYEHRLVDGSTKHAHGSTRASHGAGTRRPAD